MVKLDNNNYWRIIDEHTVKIFFSDSPLKIRSNCDIMELKLIVSVSGKVLMRTESPFIMLNGKSEMNKRQNLITFIVVLCLSICHGSHFGICRADAQTDEPQAEAEKAYLKIEGKFILSLVLVDQHGQPIAIVSSKQGSEVIIHDSNPQKPVVYITLPAEDSVVSLAPGNYHWNSVIVTDESRNLKFMARNRRSDWFKLNKGCTEILKIGAPLQQSLKVSRSGAFLNFDYKLLGAGGEEYSPRSSSLLRPLDKPKAPEFSIYKSNDKIYSGSFKYG